ncbi:uncharacterized protein SPAPADRAFT_130993 [Spathaspora passalidarum NRRL Y-27907]|uniref:PCI domain-containing protein n=1 Tax=Spathaspora passalidarum (strain NRRL Y-27907 / 11-Y1) TaxID=619300 RepID=G3AEI5_SPAPN|nr:uncharacterized protein SPAPADRAFT_130993 [Spathaspora passalidarum NRRL Y-27907]EGW34747.1 hypothetical protein SPAPADRAFT_130993 [Spathaspora passalidarum NRRL Y-27907]
MTTTNLLIDIINDSSIIDNIKVKQLSVQISQFNDVDIVSLNPSELPVDTSYKYIILLLKTEKILAQDPYNPILKQLVVDVNSIPPVAPNINENDFNSWFIKVKHNDLVTDIAYLITDLKYDNFIDLINKKLLNVKSVPTSNPYYSQLTVLIKLKILHLYLLSNYNFRNLNIAHYLQENLIAEEVSGDIWQLFENFKTNALISHDLFNLIVSANFNDNYQKIIEKMDKTKLYMNILENNIIRLSKYYTSIKISRIGEMFQFQEKGINVDLENLLFDMIIRKKLNAGSKIDQLENILQFEESAENSVQLNDHIKQVGTLISDICIRI